MTRPINPSDQITPSIDQSKNNAGNNGTATNNIIINQQIINNNSDNTQQMIDAIESALDSFEYLVPVDIEISPADIATIDPKLFLTQNPIVEAGTVDFSLPSNFSVTFSPETSGSYGTIIMDALGTQTVTVNANIGDFNGIIDYEVRVIKNG